MTYLSTEACLALFVEKQMILAKVETNFNVNV